MDGDFVDFALPDPHQLRSGFEGPRRSASDRAALTQLVRKAREFTPCGFAERSTRLFLKAISDGADQKILDGIG